MGTRKLLGGGLLIPERCQFSALAANTGASTTSSYTEANPRPGLPVVGSSSSQLRLEMSGEQSSDIDVRVQKSGQPARDGVQLAFRADGGDATSWLTCEAPTHLTGMIPLDWGNDGTRVHDIAVIPDTQDIIVARKRTSGIRLMVIDSNTHEVTEQSATLADGDDWNYPALAVLPIAGGYRIICIYGGASYYSDDQGATWTTLSSTVTTETTTNYTATSACVYRGDIVLFVEDSAAAETIHHLVSTDGGATFNLVQSTASLGVRVEAFANEDGIHVSWVDQGAAAEYRRLGTSFEPLDAVTQTVIDNGSSWQECTTWSDATGTLYALLSGTGALNAGFLVASYDSGETWGTLAFKGRCFTPDDPNDYHGHFRAAYANGQAFVLAGTHNGTAWATNRGMVFVLGGWSNLSLIGLLLQQYQEERWGWGVHDRASNDDGATYFPIYSPSNMGWTTSGAGTAAVSDTERALNTTTSSNAISHSRDLGAAVTDIVGRARLEVVSGGSTSTQDIAITVRCADASSFEYEAEVLFSISGSDVTITVNDVNGAGTDSATFTPTDYFDATWYLDKDDETFGLAYREPGDTIWVILGVAITDAGATANNSQIEWGHIASATAESNWREVHWVAAAGSNVPVLNNAIQTRYSRAFNARAEGLPTVGTSTGNAFLAVVAGPAIQGETADIDAHHDHPVEHVHCELFPGKDTTWRSSDTSEQILCYDLGANAWIGHSVGLYVAGANFRTAYLESYNGSTWDTEATLDLAQGFGETNPLEYTLSGEMVYPDTGATSDADRWMWEQELRNGVAIFNASVGPTQAATRIVAQSAGGWTQTATAIPMLQLEDVSVISTLTGTTNVRFCSPDGLVVAHQTSVKARRYWRVRIPAGTAGDDTPEGESYYEAAIIALCRVQAFGSEIGWGNTDEASPNQRAHENERGTLYSREMGVERREWSIGGWASGPTHHGYIRGVVAPDSYVASSESNALALAGYNDVFHHLRGLWRVLKGGELPCIAVEPIPDTSDETLNDPSRLLYGRISGSVRGSRLTGDYDGEGGNGEVLRVDNIRIREIP